MYCINIFHNIIMHVMLHDFQPKLKMGNSLDKYAAKFIFNNFFFYRKFSFLSEEICQTNTG